MLNAICSDQITTISEATSQLSWQKMVTLHPQDAQFQTSGGTLPVYDLHNFDRDLEYSQKCNLALMFTILDLNGTVILVFRISF